MGSSLSDLLTRGGVLLDGAMGSALIARGLSGGACSELWNIEQPEQVRAIHAAYLAAGSEVIHTNSFGGSTPALGLHGLAERAEEINMAAAALAREAVDAARSGPGAKGLIPLVAGDIGPSTQMLPPVGEADAGALTEAFAAQAEALARGGVDSLAIETMCDLREALCALAGARTAADLPVTVCLTFDLKPRGFFTLMGDTPEVVAKTLADAGATAIGCNCTLGSEGMLALCSRLVEASSLPVVCAANAGLPELLGGAPVYHQDPADFARDAAAMFERGAAAVGGCCGTDARFIAALAALRGAKAGGDG